MAKSTFDVIQKPGPGYTETTICIPFGEGKTLELSTGKLAKQAHGAVFAKLGGTVVLAAAVMDNKPTEKDFFPLMVDYREKFYAAGRIPGGFFKRESKPSDGETLKARLTDRTLRPMFPDGFKNEVQIYITVLAMDLENPAELVAMCAASAALHISEIPFVKPIAGVRVGRIDGQIVVNPTMPQFETLEMNLIVAGHRDGINMVEAGAKEMPEAEIVAGLEEAHRAIKVVCQGIEELRLRVGRPKHEFTPAEKDKALEALVAKLAPTHLKEIADTHEKSARDARLNRAVDEVHAALGEAYADRKKEVSAFFHALDENHMRERVVKHGIRADGRRPTEIRPIWTEIDVLPSVHGSAVFTRGQTQALCVATLGTSDDAQMIDDMTGTSYKRFYLHYNFPSYSVGECRPPRGPGRREIGHGMLAERAVEAVIPSKEAFPYTLRVVVDILESNGSSSMATVCSSSMALMDAGVPLIRPVAGIAMGLIEAEINGKKSAEIISDIQGIEDHCGDMDFKVCGTEVGITALQMDIKTEGVTSELLSRALDQARAGRLFILEKMAETISAGRDQMKPQTPRMTILKVPVENIREIIGSGGKVIRGITEATGAKIDIEDDGTVYVMGSNAASADAAIAMIDDILRVIEEGEIFTGKVMRVLESGAIVGLPGGKDGMIHISELEHRRVDKVEDVLNVGDEVTVKVLEIDKMRGRIRLSRKALLDKPEGGGGGGRGGDDEGGDRGGDRGGRPERGFDRGDRGGDRGPRHGGGDRGGDRGPRGGERAPDGGGLRPRRPRPPRDRE